MSEESLFSRVLSMPSMPLDDATCFAWLHVAAISVVVSPISPKHPKLTQGRNVGGIWK